MDAGEADPDSKSLSEVDELRSRVKELQETVANLEDQNIYLEKQRLVAVAAGRLGSRTTPMTGPSMVCALLKNTSPHRTHTSRGTT
jgi:hypothetical protein